MRGSSSATMLRPEDSFGSDAPGRPMMDPFMTPPSGIAYPQRFDGMRAVRSALRRSGTTVVPQRLTPTMECTGCRGIVCPSTSA